MIVLVTGAAGFIAPHVAAAFEQHGHHVIRTDARADARADALGPGSSLRHDLTSLEDMCRATTGVDIVCHLGGVGDVDLAGREPHTAAKANVLGTATALEACRCNQVGKFIYASTWEVYGQPSYQPIDEAHPCAPDHPYSITKLAGEQLVIAFDKFRGVPGIALRLGTTFGMGMRANSVFSIFIRQARQNQPITIKGSGQQTRQFTHVRDVAQAFVLAAQSDWHGHVFNIVADESISIRQLAEKIAQRLPTRITCEAARLGDPMPARVSSDKARRVLGWQPRVHFDEGLDELIEASR